VTGGRRGARLLVPGPTTSDGLVAAQLTQMRGARPRRRQTRRSPARSWLTTVVRSLQTVDVGPFVGDVGSRGVIPVTEIQIDSYESPEVVFGTCHGGGGGTTCCGGQG